MTNIRVRGEEIRHFILDSVDQHPTDICRLTAEHFGISRQAVNKHLKRLKSELALSVEGKTKNHTYKLAPQVEWQSPAYAISPGLAEDVIWTDAIVPILGNQPDNVLDIWQYGFTEMFNNAIDHSGGSKIFAQIIKTAATTEMVLRDDGIGIFKKIQIALNLLDERHAILELAKGKLTTDPERHTGEGIFFTSRMFDSFDIFSGGVFFSHEFGKPKDWILERDRLREGSSVWMKLSNHTARRMKPIFDQYVSGDDYGFTKTVVPVKLAQYGNDKLISRSQAKRLLARVELFKKVIFDFAGVPTIGPAFSDEIFRVFAHQHPEIIISSVNENEEVAQMIQRAKSGEAIKKGEVAPQ